MKIPNTSFCLAVTLLMAAFLPGELYAQGGQGLEVVLSCPDYWPGPPARGNDPSQGARQQAVTLTYDAGDLLECKVYYSHTGSVPLQDVRLELELPGRPDRVWVSQPQELPDGDPYEAAMGRVGVFSGPDEMTRNVRQKSGHIAGVYEPMARRYVWSLGEVQPGDSSQLSVEWEAQAGPKQVDELIMLRVADGRGELMLPREVPVHYVGGGAVHELSAVAPLVVDQGVGRIGAKHVLGQVAPGRRHVDVKMEVDLPYWDGSSVRVDGGYDASNPQHEELLDVSGLTARVVVDGQVLVGTLEPGQSAGPSTGPNSGKVIRHNSVSRKIEVWLGSPGGRSVELIWSAPISLSVASLPPMTSVPHRSCWSSASSPVSCRVTATSLLGVESLATPEVTYQGIAYDARGAVPTNGVTEQSALSSRSAQVTQRVTAAQDTSMGASNFEITLQAPGDTLARASFQGASWGTLHHLAYAAEMRIDVSIVPSGYGEFASISQRVMPASQPADWVRCDDALGQPSGACTLAHLTALGVAASQVQEVRFHAAHLPARYQSAFLPANPSRAAEHVEVTWRLLDTVQDSINGTTGYEPDVLFGRSVGGLTRVRQQGALAPPAGQEWLVPRTAEVDTREVDALPGTSGAGANSWSLPLATVEPGQNAYVGIRLFNDGAQTNIFGPIEFRMTLPEGFEPDSARFFPLDTMQPRVRVGRTDGAGGTTWTWNDPNYITTSYLFDPVTRVYRVFIETMHPQGGLVPIRDVGQGVPVADEVGDLIVLVHGDMLVGAPDLVEVTDVSISLDLVEEGKRQRSTLTLDPTTFEALDRAPDLRVDTAAPALVAGYQTFDYTLTLRNDAYDAQGHLLDSGATGPASNVVVYHPVTKPGDHPQVEMGRASSVLQSAHADEARAIWVSTQADPPRPLASDLGTSAGWQRCATAANLCDQPALTSLGLSPEQVRWVAFEMGDVALTDVEPRGVEPRHSIARSHHPYVLHLSVSEDGSNQDALLRTRTEVVASEQQLVRHAPADVRVDAACDTRQPFTGFDQVERCDGADNDCDGQIDEGFGLGGLCDASFDGCTVQGTLACDPQGVQICDTSALPNLDGDPFPDVCDCAPQDATRFDISPWTDTTCDFDGDGDCNAMIQGLNPAICTRGTLDCDDNNPLRNSWAFELCDDQDNDCDGQVDEGYQGLGDVCSAGQGICQRSGRVFCGGDALGVTCDAQPGSPVTEACDGLDNDCDGQTDEDFVDLGQPCGVGLGECAREGQLVCTPDGLSLVCGASPGTPQPESCNALDDDCDGQIDEDFVLGPGCVVRFAGGCEAAGVGMCLNDGTSECVLDEPEDADGDGFPDVCDCAPLDPTLDSMAAGDASSCDADGDGWCDARIEGVNPEVCTRRGDCNDSVARINPGATERCDEVDEDCDGQIDEDFADLGQPCAAGEGTCQNLGVFVCAADGTQTCSAVAGQIGAQELCDGNDNDCDGQIDEDFAQLGQGCVADFFGCELPGELTCTETGDGLSCLPDAPGDFDEDATPDACDCAPRDARFASSLSGSPGSCDRDEDGWCDAQIREPHVELCSRVGDCDDADDATYPDATELCDARDNDCDGQIDEDFFEGLGETCVVGEGACQSQGAWMCDETGQGVVCSARQIEPAMETCNGLDDDCDGQVDEDFAQLGESCSVGEGTCAVTGLWQCDGAGDVACDAQPGDEQSDEVCNGLDDDCDGQIDEDFAQLGESCSVGEGTCAVTGLWQCDGAGDVACDAQPGRPIEESCNGLDDDCDGQIDDGLPGCDMSVVDDPPQPSDYAVYGTGFCAVSTTPARAGHRGAILVCVVVCLGVFLRRRRRVAQYLGMIGVCVLASSGSEAHAQQPGEIQGRLSTQQFRPMPGGAPESMGSVAGARLLPHGELSAGVLTHYGYRPLVLVDRNTGESVDVLRHQVQSELVMGLGVGEWLEFGMGMPVIWQQSGSEQIPGGGVSSRGVGDVRASLRAGRKSGKATGFFVSGALQLSLPTGSSKAWQSDASPGFEPGVLLTWRGARGASASANVSYLLRNSSTGVLNAAGGQALRWSAGGVVPITRRSLEAYIEAFGSASAPRGGVLDDISNYPAEAMAGARLWVQRSHQISLGAGPGLTRGYGTPTVRMVAGYRFVPARAFDDPSQGPLGDEDADGVLNRDDACLGLAEDLDGFEDEDGCPDWDNDRDELLDEVDACPNDPEDRDGFEDEDGCPDEDDDRDGIPDLEDTCPHVPEDLDDVQDEDGCPEFDNDLDGLPDVIDECVLDAEDFDGFEDEDGCPDEDNDRDGVPDVRDECPEEQEIFNGVEDEDGCPDEADEAVSWTMERILLNEEVYFDTDRAKLQERSRPILRELANFLLAHPEIELVEIQGHTDDKGSQAWNMDLSWRRAENVRRYLLRRGVSPERMKVMGYGKVRPLEEGESVKARARNRRVEFRIRKFDTRSVTVADPADTGEE